MRCGPHTLQLSQLQSQLDWPVCLCNYTFAWRFFKENEANILSHSILRGYICPFLLILLASQNTFWSFPKRKRDDQEEFRICVGIGLHSKQPCYLATYRQKIFHFIFSHFRFGQHVLDCHFLEGNSFECFSNTYSNCSYKRQCSKIEKEHMKGGSILQAFFVYLKK